MALPDQTSDTTSHSDLSAQDAVSGTLMVALMAIADCNSAKATEKSVHAVMLLERLKIMENNSNATRVFMKSFELFKTNGPDRLLNLCVPSVPQELRETVFALACDLALHEESISDEVNKFLSNLTKVLDIEIEVAKKITEVLAVKHRV